MDKAKPAAISARPGGALARSIAACVFSLMLGAAAPALAAPGGGHTGGGGHMGGGAHMGGGFHGGGGHFTGGAFRGGGFHGGGFHGGGFHGHSFGFYPGLGLGPAFGLGYPWGSDDYAPYDSYSGYAAPYPTTNYYCYNPPGYYPYVTQCYSGWQPVSG